MAVIEGYKGRSVKMGQRVRVYRNLHNGKWSIMSMEGENRGLIVGYSSEVYLADATFIVNESGRQRVIRDKRKNVHAFVDGSIVDYLFLDKPNEATYNPYKYSAFVNRESEAPVEGQVDVRMGGSKCYYGKSLMMRMEV